MSEPFQLDPAKSALLVMDYQNVLLEHYVPEEQRAGVLANTARMIEAARAAHMPVIYVMVAFRQGYPEVSERNRLFSLVKQSGAFGRGQTETAIHPAVAPLDNEPVVIKHRIGAFTGTALETLLRSNGIETLVLAGVTTAGVVLSTVRQALDLDYRVVVARDGCADPDHDVHHVLLDKVIAQHAEVVPAQRVVDALPA
ncbi:cysteine hydrolase (plasmid) [Ralstonia pseudosolanacearum]|uniref:Cysteine hydrolase n=1 Tax=Ralstonia solanacearum TaxID=305 RepID=A0AA92K851_RALSL|nr:isochorismatase family cysteine hydrolase [Ralstonia pseudosolanacearum]QOK94505.1 cysteine hydrolase [Ralstonia pseudosolanacearum]QOK99858.1 cysteine hydrolase [Ralstonia pseudosolanacearum]